MKNYTIEVKNYCGSSIYLKCFKAVSATKALLSALTLDRLILEDGDQIEITEMELKRA